MPRSASPSPRSKAASRAPALAHPERAVRPRRRRRDARRGRRRAAHRRQPGRAARARDRRDERRARAADQLHPAERVGCASPRFTSPAPSSAAPSERRSRSTKCEPLNPQLARLSQPPVRPSVRRRALVAAASGGDVLWQPARPEPTSGRHKAARAVLAPFRTATEGPWRSAQSRSTARSRAAAANHRRPTR